MNQTECTELVVRAQAGDSRAFDLLATCYRPRLKHAIRRVLRNDADVEDATQLALLAAYRGLSSFRGESRFSTWLHKIGTNTAINMYNQKKSLCEMLVPELADWSDQSCDLASPDMLLEAKQTASDLQQRFDNLEPVHQLAFMLREAEGLSYQQVSEAMGCDLHTAALRVQRMRHRMTCQLSH